MPRKQNSNLLFTPEKSNEMLTENHIVKMWSSFIRSLDIFSGAVLYRNKIVESKIADDITPHILRHTYATDLYRMGIDLKTAQYLLGHSDIRMTADIYTHADESRTQGILQAQNSLYSSEVELDSIPQLSPANKDIP